MKTSIIIDRLQDHGIKPSLQRIAIMEYLMGHYNHPTADVIFNKLYPVIPTLSKTTVYNTLKLLAYKGAISEITIDEKNVRYDAEISPHAHFRCKYCGNVFDFPVKNLSSVVAKEIDGFLITDAQLYYKGYCKKCKTKASQLY
ncbi:MAG: transcriptional repressor [Prevotellaceae bacterium]|jgi:Fur family ferric uptake transcriptional regulator/Fur family peroxide stress response transcriptional regulator|nr:transcriptional repressor [Prevotellaceae bacterium]